MPAARISSASASSTQLFFTTRAAVDGDRSTRWSSGRSDDQWLRVDLGAARPVARVVLRWEAAYAREYRVDVSTDGERWRTVWSTDAGDGGVRQAFGALGVGQGSGAGRDRHRGAGHGRAPIGSGTTGSEVAVVLGAGTDTTGQVACARQ